LWCADSLPQILGTPFCWEVKLRCLYLWWIVMASCDSTLYKWKQRHFRVTSKMQVSSVSWGRFEVKIKSGRIRKIRVVQVGLGRYKWVSSALTLIISHWSANIIGDEESWRTLSFMLHIVKNIYCWVPRTSFDSEKSKRIHSWTFERTFKLWGSLEFSPEPRN
jgi:hypothetical protein